MTGEPLDEELQCGVVSTVLRGVARQGGPPDAERPGGISTIRR